MHDEPTTFGLSPQQVADLLNVGADTAAMPDDKEHQKAELLSNLLNATVPAWLAPEQASSEKGEGWMRTVEPLAGDPVARLLQDPGTDMSLVRRIKDHSSRMSSIAGSKAEHQATNTVYFAAIAHALVFHDQRITRLSYHDLRKAFHSLSGQRWIPGWLTSMFEGAGKKCQTKTK